MHRICFDGAAVRHNLDCCTDNSTRGEDLLHVNKASGSIRGFSFFVLDAARGNRWLGVRAAEGMFRAENIPFLDTSAVSIEEIAATLLQQTGLKRRLYG